MSKENNLINRIRLIFTHLKSQEIIEFLNQWNIDKVKLLSLVIESKLGYDMLINDPDCRSFINDIEESAIYTTAEYSQLVMFIATMGENNSRFNNDIGALNKFQVFHKMLFKTGSLVLKLMADQSGSATYNLDPVSNPLVNHVSLPPQANPAIPAALKVVAMNYSMMQSTERTEITPKNEIVTGTTVTRHDKDIPNGPTHFPDSLYQNLSLDKKDLKHDISNLSETSKASNDETFNEEENISLNSFLKSLSMYNIPTEAS